jgi:hypothetical protein
LLNRGRGLVAGLAHHLLRRGCGTSSASSG